MLWTLAGKAGETKWSLPEIIADTPFHSDGNAVVWQAPDGRARLFYVCRFGDTWSTSRIKGKISGDGAHTWSDSFMVALDSKGLYCSWMAHRAGRR